MSDGWRPRFRWWIVPALLAAVLVVALGIAAILFLTREVPQARSVQDVIEEFRSTSTSTTPRTSTSALTMTSTTTTPAADPASPDLRPPAGVYVLEGAGREEISFPPVAQDDGATMPATVSHGADECWTFTIHYNEAHWADWQLCPDGDRLFETGGHTFQRWDFGIISVENLSTFICEPPALFASRGDDAGSRWDRSCEGTGNQVAGVTTSSGTLTFIAVERLEIGGEMHDALHVRRESVLTGAQTGMDSLDLWLAVENGLPLRGERDAIVESDSPIGSVSYAEEGHWQLTSTGPVDSG